MSLRGIIGLKTIHLAGTIALTIGLRPGNSLALKFDYRTTGDSAAGAYVTIFGKATGDHDFFQRIPESRPFRVTEDSARVRDSSFLEILPLAKGHHAAYHIVFWEDFHHPPAPPGELAYPLLAMTKRPEILSTLSWSATVLPTGILSGEGLDPWLGSVVVLISKTGDTLSIQWMKPDAMGSLREIPREGKSTVGTGKSFKVLGKKSVFSFDLILE